MNFCLAHMTAALALAVTMHAQAPAFEVASVKPSNPSLGGGGGGRVTPPALDASPAPAPPPPGGGGGPESGRSTFQVEHRRFTARNFSLFALVLQAYDLKGCAGPGDTSCALISGGPAWIRSEKFDIDAKGADDSPDYTMTQFITGEAPELRRMLQTLLADRFSLKFHREMKELPVYALAVGKNGAKLKEASEKDNGSLVWGMTRKPNGEAAIFLTGKNRSMPQFADSLSGLAGRTVLDRTGLKGEFDFAVEYALDSDAPGATPFAGPSMFTAFQEQLGLKLDATRAPIEILVIDSVAKPSVN